MNSNDPLASLSQEIRREYDRLMKVVAPIPASVRILKKMEGAGGKVSVTDLIAYQIGWGHCLIRWYEAGIKGETPIMPGEGFSTWDYPKILKQRNSPYEI
jgi:hypothetical protein